jgi:hypothetical protein
MNMKVFIVKSYNSLFMLSCLFNYLDLLDIFDDVREECSKFGNVLDMKIPRPGHGGSETGIGKVIRLL